MRKRIVIELDIDVEDYTDADSISEAVEQYLVELIQERSLYYSVLDPSENDQPDVPYYDEDDDG